MRRRLVGVVLSIALAAVGTLVLVGYVQSAHQEAGAAEQTASVLIVTREIPRGTKANELDGKVRLVDIPQDTKIDGAVSSTAALAGKVAATSLLPGEQVLLARFQAPELLGREGVPQGLLEVTVQLSAERALGGEVRPGDTVAVLSSFEPFDISAAGQPAGANIPEKTPNTTHVILHDVRVTNVQVTEAVKESSDDETEDEEGRKQPEMGPRGDLYVTLALDATSVQRVVFSAEFGSLWLSAEPADAPDGETRIETRGSVY